MDPAAEDRLFETLGDISGGITELKVQMGEVKTDAKSTKNYCESISDRVKELDKDGTRLCKTNETSIDNLEDRVDKVERAKSGKPLIIGGVSVAGVIGAIQGAWLWFTRGSS